MQDMVKVLGVDNFSLVFLIVKDSEFKGFGFVEKGHQAVGVFADGDLGIAQSISGAVGLDLVDDFLELESQVFG